MRHEIDRGISDVSAALGDPKYLAPFFRIPGLARSRLIESELAARELSVFSSDTDADDWHHRISGQQIIALAMRRLEGRGKGILLLHDIHPATVAALPGLLKAFKDNGFRIVQVVPAAPDVIAMANKPKAPSLASTLPGEAISATTGIAARTRVGRTWWRTSPPITACCQFRMPRPSNPTQSRARTSPPFTGRRRRKRRGLRLQNAGSLQT